MAQNYLLPAQLREACKWVLLYATWLRESTLSASFRRGLDVPSQFKRVQRTANPFGGLFADMGIPLGGPNVPMPPLFLNVSNIGPTFQQMRSKRMAQRMKGRRLMDARLLLRVLENVLCRALRQMIRVILSRKQPLLGLEDAHVITQDA